MNNELQTVIERLSPAQLRELTARAQEMVMENESKQSDEPDRFLSLSWAGMMSDAPEQSGLEAQATANRLRVEAIERSLSK